MSATENGMADADALPAPATFAETLRGAVALAILLFIFVSFNPFTDLGDPKLLEVSSGNEAATYIALFLLVGLAGMLLYGAGSLPFPLLATRENFLLLGWLLVVSVGLSVDVNTSARRFVLSFGAFLLAAMLPWLTRGLRHFANLLLAVAVLILVLSYLGLLVIPHLSIHQPTDIAEPELAGDWRGIFGHKNGAASVMDRKSTRLNSSHANISYAVFCL